MNKKILIVILLIIAGITYFSTEQNKSNDLKIGAVLPLSGPASIWGENVKKGMELALKGKSIEVIYEDSKGKAPDGISAFHILKGKKVDIMVSALSSVSVPLSKVALDEKFPLLATLTAANAISNDYTTRYYSNAQNFAEASFNAASSPVIGAKKIAILYRNDELGSSVASNIEKLSAGREIVMKESFNPGEADFSTLLLKVKNSKADVLLFVPVTPIEAVGIIKTSKQLGIQIPLIEASNVFADMNTRLQAENIPFYSNSYEFSKTGNSEEFKSKYKATYGSEPNFAAAFGYDLINLLDTCKDQKEAIQACVRAKQEFVGVAGKATQITPGDFNVPLNFEKVN